RLILGDDIFLFLELCKKADYSYSSTPQGAIGRLQPTVEAAIIYNLHGLTIKNPEKTKEFLVECQKSQTQFSEIPEAPPAPRDSLLGSVALHLLFERTQRDQKTRSTTKPGVIARDLWHLFVNLAVWLASSDYVRS